MSPALRHPEALCEEAETTTRVSCPCRVPMCAQAERTGAGAPAGGKRCAPEQEKQTHSGQGPRRVRKGATCQKRCTRPPVPPSRGAPGWQGTLWASAGQRAQCTLPRLCLCTQARRTMAGTNERACAATPLCETAVHTQCCAHSVLEGTCTPGSCAPVSHALLALPTLHAGTQTRCTWIARMHPRAGMPAPTYTHIYTRMHTHTHTEVCCPTWLVRWRPRTCSACLGGAQVALGMAAVKTGEVQYDQRLFNQEQGLGSGFGADDSYGVYDKALFADRRCACGPQAGSVRVGHRLWLCACGP